MRIVCPIPAWRLRCEEASAHPAPQAGKRCCLRRDRARKRVPHATGTRPSNRQINASNLKPASWLRLGCGKARTRVKREKLTVHARESTICRQNFTEISIGLLFHQAMLV